MTYITHQPCLWEYMNQTAKTLTESLGQRRKLAQRVTSRLSGFAVNKSHYLPSLATNLKKRLSLPPAVSSW
jgi:hypothetical protein